MGNEMTDRRIHSDAAASAEALRCEIASVVLKNPLIAASGCYGFGYEMAAYYPPATFGAIAMKALTLEPRAGNPGPRIAECEAGILNAVGLQNPGVETALRVQIPRAAAYGVPLIANVAGATAEAYPELCSRLSEAPIVALELNLSCPNVREGCLAFGVYPASIEAITRACRAATDKAIWVKLSPNVHNIEDCARAAEAGGADAVSLINTLLGMALDLKTRRPILRNNHGGYSGPGVKAVALRMVNDVFRSVRIPVVGMGGIARAEDVLEFIMAGASAVQLGTCLLRDPYAPLRILEELPSCMARYGIRSLRELKGTLQLWT